MGLNFMGTSWNELPIFWYGEWLQKGKFVLLIFLPFLARQKPDSRRRAEDCGDLMP